MKHPLQILTTAAMLVAVAPFASAAPDDAVAPVGGSPIATGARVAAPSPFKGKHAAIPLPKLPDVSGSKGPLEPPPLGDEQAEQIAKRSTDCAHVGTADGKAMYRVRGEYVFGVQGARLCETLKPLLATVAPPLPATALAPLTTPATTAAPSRPAAASSPVIAPQLAPLLGAPIK